jgi:hypothetical protein
MNFLTIKTFIFMQIIFKSLFMSNLEIKTELHRLIDQVDERFLKALYLMVSAYQEEKPLGYNMDGTPIFGSVLGKELDKEVEAAKQGRYISVEELEKRSEQWMERTR